MAKLDVIINLQGADKVDMLKTELKKTEKIKVDADTTDASKKLLSVKKEANIKSSIKVDADTTSATKNLALVKQSVPKNASFKVASETTLAQKNIDNLKKPIKPSIDISQISSGIDKVKSSLVGVGEIVIGGNMVKSALGPLDNLYNKVGGANKQMGVFKRMTGESIPATFLDDSINKYRLTQEEAISTANRFARLGAGAGLSGQELSAFSTEIAGLSIDLANFSGTDLTQAENAMATFIKTGRGTALKELGVNVESMKNKLEELGPSATEADRALLLKNTLAGQEGLKGFTATMSSSKAESEKASKELEQGMIDSMRELRKVIDPVIITLSKWITQNPRLTATVGALAVAFLGLGAIAGIITSIVGAINLLNFTALVPLISSTWAWTVALLANPITWIVLGIVALIAIIVLLIANWDAVSQAFMNFIKPIIPLVNQVVSFFVSAWNSIIQAVTFVFESISSIISSVFGVIVSAVSAYINLLVVYWTSVFDAVSFVMSAVFDIVSSVFGFIVNAISVYINTIISIFNGIISVASNVFNTVFNFVNGAMSRIGGVVGSVVGGVISSFNSITGAVGGVWDSLTSGASNAVKSIISFFSGIGDRIGSFFNGALDNFKNMIPGPLRGALGLYSGEQRDFGFGQSTTNNMDNREQTVNIYPRSQFSATEVFRSGFEIGGELLALKGV